MPAFAALFTQPRVVLLAWLHLLTLDLFQAKYAGISLHPPVANPPHRGVFLDGVRHGVWTAHSVVLCFMFGPLGLLSHWLTKAAAKMLGRTPREQEYIVYRF